MTVIESLAFLLIIAAVVLSMYRLIAGPDTADRIISGDMLTLITTVILVFLAVVFDSPLYLDVALIYAVISFAGIIALAQVIESGNRAKHKQTKTSQAIKES